MASAKPLVIYHIGLPLDHPAVPEDMREKVRQALSELEADLRAKGLDYSLVWAAPETGLADFVKLLETHPCDGVVIGGGVRSFPTMNVFFEQILNQIRVSAPQAKILLITKPSDVPDALKRWFTVSL